MFVGPWDTLLTSVYALFGIASDGSVGLQDVLGDACKNAISIISYGWMIIYPLAMYIYMRVKKQLVPRVYGYMEKHRFVCLFIWNDAYFGNSLQFESYNYWFDGIGIYDFVDSDNLLSQ